MSDNRALFVEEAISGAVKRILTGRVNEILGEAEFVIPIIEFGGNGCGYAASPALSLSTCEKTEKERIVRLDAYAMTIRFSLPESPESELHCYAYAAALELAFMENPTLGGVASRAVLTGKKYAPPRKPHCGEGWELVVSLRITIEGGGYAG